MVAFQIGACPFGKKCRSGKNIVFSLSAGGRNGSPGMALRGNWKRQLFNKVNAWIMGGFGPPSQGQGVSTREMEHESLRQEIAKLEKENGICQVPVDTI